MFDFFGTVINYIETFFRYLGMIISNIIAALAYLVTSQQAITVIMGYMPTVIGGACLAFIAIAVMRFLLMK